MSGRRHFVHALACGLMLHRQAARTQPAQRVYRLGRLRPNAQGKLMAYGPVVTNVYRRLASHANRIHNGGRPRDLPWNNPPNSSCSST